VEQWIDEGAVRAEAEAATRRATSSGPAPASSASGATSSTTTTRRSTGSAHVDPAVAAEVLEAVGPRRSERMLDRLASASAALDRERFDEARRLAAPVVRELPHLAAGHEIVGLANYRLGRWKQAATELEVATSLRPSPELLPVLADCYRALRRWHDVERVWTDVRAASPSHEIMAEARIVAAGALADRGDLAGAIDLMQPAAKPPKRVREHHLRQWYALADFYDRAGDTVLAARWFRTVAEHDREFVDVADRLRALGR
jgi:tetratricopeptide (TPR) repeat protein